MFWTKCLMHSPSRKANSAPGVCSSYLNKMPGSYNLVSNRKKLPVPRTPGTTYELFSTNPISERRHTCVCQEQSLHVDITVQYGVFSRLYGERVRGILLTVQFWLQIFMCQSSQVKQSTVLEELKGHKLSDSAFIWSWTWSKCTWSWYLSGELYQVNKSHMQMKLKMHWWPI